MSYINVMVDASDIESDDLIDVLEDRGYRVLMPGQIDEDIEAFHRQTDDIHALLDSFYAWKDGGLKNEWFDRELKSFFETTIDKKVL